MATIFIVVSRSMLGNVISSQSEKLQAIRTSMIQNLDEFQANGSMNQLKLYPHQIEAIEKFRAHLEEGNTKGFFVSATGTGKTRMFLSKILATKAKTMILVPTKALVNQTKERLLELLKKLDINITIGIVRSGKKQLGDGEILITTYQSLRFEIKKSQGKRFIPIHAYDLIVMDEAHLSLTTTAKEVIDELSKDKIVIGCTATPSYNTRRDSEQLRNVSELLGMNSCYFEYPIIKAIQDGSLSPVHMCVVTTDTCLIWERGKKKFDRNRELSESEISAVINIERLNVVVAELYKNVVYPKTNKPILGTQSVVFCAGIEHARSVSETINKLLIDDSFYKNSNIKPAAYISGEMSGKEQNEILNEFNDGKISMLCGADILITGLDNPNVETIFNLRPTRSDVMAQQRVGRAFRLSSTIPNKVALVFEFNWIVDNQIFVGKYIGNQCQLGAISPISSLECKSDIMTRKQISHSFSNGAYWELNWNGRIPQQKVEESKPDIQFFRGIRSKRKSDAYVEQSAEARYCMYRPQQLETTNRFLPSIELPKPELDDQYSAPSLGELFNDPLLNELFSNDMPDMSILMPTWGSDLSHCSLDSLHHGNAELIFHQFSNELLDSSSQPQFVCEPEKDEYRFQNR